MVIFISEDLKNYKWAKTKIVSRNLVFKLINQFKDDFLKYEIGIAISTLIINGERGIYVFFKTNEEGFEGSDLNAFIENNPESFYLGDDTFVLNNDVLDLKSKNANAIKEQAFNFKFFPESTFVHTDYYHASHHFKKEKNYSKYLNLVDLYQFFIKTRGKKYLNSIGIKDDDIRIIKSVLKREIIKAKNAKETIPEVWINFIDDFYDDNSDALFRIIADNEKFHHFLED